MIMIRIRIVINPRIYFMASTINITVLLILDGVTTRAGTIIAIATISTTIVVAGTEGADCMGVHETGC